MWRSENDLPNREANSDPSVIQAVASRYTDCATVARHIQEVLGPINGHFEATHGFHYSLQVEVVPRLNNDDFRSDRFQFMLQSRY
jgi:hypothetical protein